MTIQKYTSEIPEIKTNLKEINNLKRGIKKCQRRLKTLKNKYNFIELIIGIGVTGTELEKSVYKLFRDLGFIRVIHSGKKKNLADIEIDLGDKIILIEIKGIKSDNPTDSECSQIHKYIKRKEKKSPNLKVYGFFMVNHDNAKYFEQRNINPFDDIKIGDAENSNYGLMTTCDLLKFYLDVKIHNLSNNELINIICQKGLIKYQNTGSKNPAQ